MIIGGLQKLSMVDYPGKMACTIFLFGCNFRCPYCHNSGLLIPEEGQTFLEEKEVLAFLKKRQGLLEGVCISGGEPLLQGEKIIPFLKKIKELGYSVKLDTNGTFPELLKELCESKLVDYVAMDIKQSRAKYDTAIGRNLAGEQKNAGRTDQEDEGHVTKSLIEKVQESAEYLMESKIDYEFRTTLVKGIHEPQDIADMVEWIGGAKFWYLQNFKDSGNILSPNSLKMEPFSENEIKLFEKTAKERKMNVFVRNV